MLFQTGMLFFLYSFIVDFRFTDEAFRFAGIYCILWFQLTCNDCVALLFLSRITLRVRKLLLLIPTDPEVQDALDNFVPKESSVWSHQVTPLHDFG